jgi:hypothetical protein
MEALRRALAVQAAVAHDLNNELTIILSTLQDAISDLEPNDPMRPELIEARSSAQRCAWKVSGMLNYCNRGMLNYGGTCLEIHADGFDVEIDFGPDGKVEHASAEELNSCQ